MKKDKCGRVEHPSWLFQGFKEAMENCGLKDIIAEGYPFTWFNSRGIGRIVGQSYGNFQVVEFIPRGQIVRPICSILDHLPILLQIKEMMRIKYKHAFRFENSWLYKKDLDNVVPASQEKNYGFDVMGKLLGCVGDLDFQGRNQLKSQFKDEIKRCKRGFKFFCDKQDPYFVSHFNSLRENMTNLLLQGKSYWK